MSRAGKQRMSVTIDADIVAAVDRAVRASGESVSAWVNKALRERLEHEARLDALGVALREFEAEHGAMSDEEIAERVRDMRSRAIRVPRTSASKAGESRRKYGTRRPAR